MDDENRNELEQEVSEAELSELEFGVDFINKNIILDDGNIEIKGSDDSIAKMFTALAKYYGEVSNPENNADNPYFKSKYAPLSEVLNTIRPIMGKYGLSIIQVPKTLNGGVGSVQTILTHKDGAWMAFPALQGKPAKPDIQGVGAVITYLRRFSINAIAGVAGEVDDDGNAAAAVNDTKAGAKNTTLKKENPLRTELVSMCVSYVNNDPKKRKEVVDALKAVVPTGDIDKIKTDADFKKAIDIVKKMS